MQTIAADCKSYKNT